MLRKAGFLQRAGKGSHTVWSHPQISDSTVLSGDDGADVRPFQEKDVRAILKKLEQVS